MNFSAQCHNESFDIYVIDDDRVTLKLIESLLSKDNFCADTFLDSKEAWLALEKQKTPAVIFLDWSMPVLDGIKLTKLIKSRSEHFYSYLIMITSHATIENTVEAFDAGVDDFLEKPVVPELLRCRMKSAERFMQRELELIVEQNYLSLHASQMESLVQEQAKQLVDADRMVTLGTMSAGIAHEINNPTAFISGNVQNLETYWEYLEPQLRSLPPDEITDKEKFDFVMEGAPKAIAGIQKGVERISKIVKSLKTYSHVKGNKQERCNIEKLIQDSLELSKTNMRKDITILVELEDQLPEPAGDFLKLEQVIVNILVNASHAMEDVKEPVLKVAARAMEQGVTIDIQDNGPGIPDKMLSRLWTPFFTTKEVGKGTGLGLYICRNIVEEHDGKISASNTDEGGACFTIKLPVSEESQIEPLTDHGEEK